MADARLDRMLAEFPRVKEQVQLLAGVVGDEQKSKSAVQRGELQALGSLPLQSSQITGAPTQAQYNALQADVAAIFNALQTISNYLGNATIPKI